ncbi:hypothetical protein WDU94_011173 [Cyamophila willieti]
MTSNTPVKKVPIHLQSSQNRLLIKNGKVVNADKIADLDIYIENGVIQQLGRNLIVPGGVRIIDAGGCYVIPGGIDPHTHFELELMGATTVDDFYHGTKAAVAGGTTTIIDFALPRRGQSLLDTYKNWRQKADEKVCCDYALHMGITWWSEQVQQEMAELCEKHGINSFKAFMAYKGLYQLSDSELYDAFQTVRNLGAVAMVHAENGDIIAKNTEKLLSAGIKGPEGHQLSRPEEVEAEAVTRACTIANQVDCPLYVVHIMSKSAGDAMAYKRKELMKKGKHCTLYGETLAAAIGTHGNRIPCTWHDQAAHVLSPPLRPDETTPNHLLTLLNENALQCTGSDNCTFNKNQKELGKDSFTDIPNGVNGVQDRLSVIWEKGVVPGILSPEKFVAVTSTNAAKIFNLYPRKGVIAEGSDADVVVWNYKAKRTISAKTHAHACDYNIFEGLECHGVPEFVIVGGRVCVDEGNLRVAQGHGNFLPTPINPPFVYEGQTPEVEVDHKENHQVIEEIREQLHGLTPNNNHKISAPRSPSYSSTSSVYGDNVDNYAHSIHTGKGMRQEGQRDLQSSSMSVCGEIEGVGQRASIRVRNPPGGKSSGFW